ncbi:hypothetical protein [Swaminathania salitolerans]|uniref:Lipoprotein n=2 Tax=Swaminathania salitolerans TaxID=182838 RepID=A0A511BKT4_9PROT|nr:hypothetical protein [Swaminathania salitolerans]GBQ09490.1 hypothetical protein AA21291_0092 [Swaminathania salitolerans LMG 21291]GEL00951.1 hypothetical protein SSA02_01140 [Swaminathania salitolerans]
MTNASSRAFLKVRLARYAVAALATVLVSGCAPPGQRLFNPDAGKPPRPHIPPAPPAKPAPAPFLAIVAGTPEEAWAPAVDRATKRALARQPSLLFVVSVVSPRVGSPGAQVEALEHLIREDGQAVADRIVSAGARPEQVQLEARTDPAAPRAGVRVDLR